MSKKKISGVVVFFCLCALAGCDQLNKLYNYVSTRKEAKLQKPVTQSLTQPQDLTQVSPAASTILSGKDQDSSQVLARIGNWTLTIEEFKQRLQALKEVVPEYDIKNMQQNKLVLEELIRQQLLVQEAEQKGLDKNKDITMAIEEFRRTLLVRELATQLTEGLTTTEEEAQKYYEDNTNEFAEPGEWHLREIVVETKDEAKEILIELLKGTDFAQMATQKSKSGSAAKGGDLGYVSEFAFPQLEAAVATLDIGGISSVLEGPQGFYLIKVEEKKGGAVQDFEKIKEDVKAGLTLLKQQQAILKHLDELQQKTGVEVNEKLLQE